MLSAMSSSLSVNILYQARCEVQSQSICMPIQFIFLSGGSCLVMPTMGGYKNCVPILIYMVMRDDTDLLDMYSMWVGLSDVTYDSATDEECKLIFVADHSRIKSYAWGSPLENYAKPVVMHTLSSSSKGPLTIIVMDIGYLSLYQFHFNFIYK